MKCHAALLPFLAIGLSLAAVTDLGAQAPPVSEPADEQEVPVFGVESAVVLLDVVVRDKKGRLVKDLQASDFEVYENGERQTITDFQIIDRGSLHFSPSSRTRDHGGDNGRARAGRGTGRGRASAQHRPRGDRLHLRPAVDDGTRHGPQGRPRLHHPGPRARGRRGRLHPRPEPPHPPALHHGPPESRGGLRASGGPGADAVCRDARRGPAVPGGGGAGRYRPRPDRGLRKRRRGDPGRGGLGRRRSGPSTSSG